jgi:precorrin-6B methylase 2
MALGRMAARWSVPLVLLLGALSAAQPAAAQLASRSAEEWIKTLNAPDRIQRLKVAEVLEALALKPGQIVADIGAGTGVFTLQFGLKVKPGGTVYAVDIDKALTDYIEEQATEQGMINVHGIVGGPTDPLLPVDVDLAFINDVLHHIENRATYLETLALYLKPGARVAVIDFIPEQSPHKADPTLVVSEAQTTAMMAKAGLKPVQRVELYTDRYFVLYGR